MNPYYPPTAYRSDQIPAQPFPQQKWGKRLKLPWGNTQSVYYDIYYPQALRNDEQLAKDIAEGKESDDLSLKSLHICYDHECFRYAQGAWLTRILVFIRTFSMVGSVAVPPVILFGYFVYLYITYEDGSFIERTIKFLPAIYIYVLPWIIVWLLCYAIMRWLPATWWLKPSKRASWEFNRRNGMVTVFQRNQQFIAPFYEWDAYVNTTPDRSGFMTYSLHLAHRYKKVTFPLKGMVPMGYDPELHYAYWDFLQNYMDTTQPLPDMPTFEPYRHLDPVTAAYDQQTGRNPRYWVEMDDTTWKQAKMAMANKIKAIDTLKRPNLIVNSYSQTVTHSQGHFEYYKQ